MFGRKIQKESNVAYTPETSKKSPLKKINMVFFVLTFLSIVLYSSYTLFIIYIYNWCVWVLKSSTVSCLLFECYKGKIYILIIEIRLFLLSNFNAVSIGTCVVKPASDFWWSKNCSFGEHKVCSKLCRTHCPIRLGRVWRCARVLDKNL